MINNQGNAIYNGEFIARSRLRVDTRKWLASKLVPKIYGTPKIDKVARSSLIEKLLFDSESII